MKAVQSFWVQDKNISQLHTITGGWIDARYHLMSWCLSCLLLKKHFGKVSLVTDLDGKTILIDWLKLPYDEVKIDLESQKLHIKKMWVLGKLYTYSIQDEPFLHVDGDVFMWQKPAEDLLNAELISQNYEIGFALYKKCLEACDSQGIDLPPFIQNAYPSPCAANAGIIGGQNVTFFKELYQEVVSFLKDNQPKIDNATGVNDMPIILEQLAYYELAQANGLKISTLRPDSHSGTLNNLADFVDLYDQAKPCTYIHLLGLYKHHLFYCKQMEAQLKLMFPEYHQRVIDLLNNGQWRFEDVLIGHEHNPDIPEISVLDHNVLKAIEKPFKRTNKIIELLSLKLPYVTPDNLEDVQEWVLLQAAEYPYNLLADCINFEVKRFENLKKAVAEAPVRQQEEWQRLQFFETHFTQPIANRLHHCVQLSPYHLFSESTWNWTNVCPTAEEYKAGYAIMNPVINFQTLYLQEYILDDLSNFIVNITQEPITITQIVEKIQALHQTPLTAKTQERLHLKLDQRIKEMYLNGMIDYLGEKPTIQQTAAITAYA